MHFLILFTSLAVCMVAAQTVRVPVPSLDAETEDDNVIDFEYTADDEWDPKREPENQLFEYMPCSPYEEYSKYGHPPLAGDLQLSYARPPEQCRKFSSQVVESVIGVYKARLKDPNIKRLFENCFPNTLDTTIEWHESDCGDGMPRTFIITGDIKAEWIRDSRYQLQNYMALSAVDHEMRLLIEGAIHTQAEFLARYPYCNAMQPPRGSGMAPSTLDGNVHVTPEYDCDEVYECKYELDSIAAFFGLSADYYKATKDIRFIGDDWMRAARVLYRTLTEQQIPTFSRNGSRNKPFYAYQCETFFGTETLPMGGAGNPVHGNTHLVKSAFRPSDDATIYPFLIPSNALMSVELFRASEMLKRVDIDLSRQLSTLAQEIEDAIWEFGIYEHPVFGTVFAYEVDGYGGVNMMDDANVPSLLSLPDFGFVDIDDEIYQNTREMILSQHGNPYFSRGTNFGGIGSPHVGPDWAWPMSHLVAIRTSHDESEIMRELEVVKRASKGLGLMHESINNDGRSLLPGELPQENFDYTRPWFAWANSEFAKTILHLAQHMPHLVLDNDEPINMAEALSVLPVLK